MDKNRIFDDLKHAMGDDSTRPQLQQVHTTGRVRFAGDGYIASYAFGLPQSNPVVQSAFPGDKLLAGALEGSTLAFAIDPNKLIRALKSMGFDGDRGNDYAPESPVFVYIQNASSPVVLFANEERKRVALVMPMKMNSSPVPTDGAETWTRLAPYFETGEE